MTTTVRAKLRCESVKLSSTEPYEVDDRTYTPAGEPVDSKRLTWPRVYAFSATYDESIPEDVRYARYTPYAKLEMNVDNPAVTFEPGRHYYVDFTEVGA